jgi:hypothetical protein
MVAWVSLLTDGERWLFGLLFVFSGTIVMALVTHRLAARRDQNGAKRNATAKFRASVLSALNGVYPLPFVWPADITQFLTNAAPQLQIAIHEFRPFVPWWRRPAFDRAWLRYRCGTGREADIQNYHHYIAFGSNPDPKETFRRNVASLLDFTS